MERLTDAPPGRLYDYGVLPASSVVCPQVLSQWARTRFFSRATWDLELRRCFVRISPPRRAPMNRCGPFLL